MLMLGRKEGESVVLYDTETQRWYTVKLIEVRGAHCQSKLGVEAPPALKVFRTEIMSDAQVAAYQARRPMTAAELAENTSARKAG